jgi:hypothetical protein
MSSSFQDHRSRAEQYAERKKLQLDDQLGFGNQGTVFATDVDSAIKVHEIMEEWQQEKQVLFEGQGPDVQLILFQLERYGIYLYDVHPGNIRLTK